MRAVAPRRISALLAGISAAAADSAILDPMASRTLKFSQWLKLMARHALEADQTAYKNLAGYPSIDVAKKLDVSKQRISQLVQEGALDTLDVTNALGRVSVTLITEASLERYLDQRVPDRNRQGYFAFQA